MTSTHTQNFSDDSQHKILIRLAQQFFFISSFTSWLFPFHLARFEFFSVKYLIQQATPRHSRALMSKHKVIELILIFLLSFLLRWCCCMLDGWEEYMWMIWPKQQLELSSGKLVRGKRRHEIRWAFSLSLSHRIKWMKWLWDDEEDKNSAESFILGVIHNYSRFMFIRALRLMEIKTSSIWFHARIKEQCRTHFYVISTRACSLFILVADPLLHMCEVHELSANFRFLRSSLDENF